MRLNIGLRLLLLPATLLLVHCADVVTGSPQDGGTGGEGGDPCDTNLCECDNDGDCDSHEVCDTSGPGRLCVCAPAYEDTGSGCEFAGAPEDPGFEDGTPWQGSAGAGINPLAAGDIDPGEAFFSEGGVCALSTVTQTFTMPDFDRAERFAVDINYRQFIQDAFGFDRVGAIVNIDGGWNEFLSQTSYAEQSFCLGEAGYGGDVSFELSPNQISNSCDGTPITSLSIDRFAVRVAGPGECPAPGTVLNGNFEDSSGWEFVTTGDGVAEYAAGAGVGASRGAQLTTATRCSSAGAKGSISLPTEASVPSTAVQFSLTGTSTPVEVSFGDQAISRLVRNSGSRVVCVPEWAKGSAQSITFALPRLHSTGECSVARARDVVIDNISIVSEPGFCGADRTLDLGFEIPLDAPDIAPGWAVTDGAVNGTEAPADILVSPGEAHSGNGVLRLTATNFCNGSFASRRFLVPDANGENGPAIRFFGRVPAGEGESGIRVVDGAVPPVQLVVPETGVWEQSIICIPQRHIRRPLTIEIFATGGGGGCSDFMTPLVGFFDDVEITTDPLCPVM